MLSGAATTNVRARLSGPHICLAAGPRRLDRLCAAARDRAAVGLVSPHYLPPFSAIVVALFKETDDARRSGWRSSDTLEAWAIGLVISLVAGVVIGIAIGSSQSAADLDPFDHRVPAADSVGRAHPARGAAVRLADPVDAGARRLRVVLAGADPGALRRAGRRSGGARDCALLSARRLGADPLRDLADHAALPDDRRAARGGGGAHSRHHQRNRHRHRGSRQGDFARPNPAAPSPSCTPMSSSPELSASSSISARARWSGGCWPGIRRFVSIPRRPAR